MQDRHATALAEFQADEQAILESIDASQKVILEQRQKRRELYIQNLETQITQLQAEPVISNNRADPNDQSGLTTKIVAVLFILFILICGVIALPGLLSVINPSPSTPTPPLPTHTAIVLTPTFSATPRPPDSEDIQQVAKVPLRPIEALTLQENGLLWFVQVNQAGIKQLFHLDTTQGRDAAVTAVNPSAAWQASVEDKAVHSLMVDCRGTVWVLIEDRGIYLLPADRLYDMTSPELELWGLERNTQLSSASRCTEEGVEVWFTGSGGEGIKTLTYRDDPTEFTAVLPNSESNVWNKTRTLNDMDRLLLDGNQLWVADSTQHQIYTIALDNVSTRPQTYLDEQDNVTEAFTDLSRQWGGSGVWAATASVLISVIPGQETKLLQLPDGRAAVSVASDQTWIWFVWECYDTAREECQSQHLSVIAHHEVEQQPSPVRLSDEQIDDISLDISQIHDLVIDDQGQVWFATDRGLYVYQALDRP